MFDYQLLNGIFAPVVTPFTEQEKICYEAIRDNILMYNSTKLRGYMPLGSNGEFQGLSDEEAAKVLAMVCRYKSEDKVVVGGCGRESAYKTVEFIKMIADYGLDLAFILPPHYFAAHMTDENFYRYYMQVADGAPIPIVVYNAPKFSSGLNLSAQLVGRLAGHENIVAVKNSAQSADSEYIQATRGESFGVLAGNISKLFPSLLSGAVGGVISTASYLPEYCCRVFELFRSGQEEEAEKLWILLRDLSAALIGPMGVAGVKLGMELRGMTGGRVRNPLMDASESQRQMAMALFEENGISPTVGGEILIAAL